MAPESSQALAVATRHYEHMKPFVSARDFKIIEDVLQMETGYSSIVRNDWGEVLNESTLEVPETGE
jgi:hypothetical protein